MSETPDQAHYRIEQRALIRSVFGYVSMAVVGIGFALATGSEAILLDGVYSLVSFVMALLARRIVALTRKPGSNTFHFGFAHFEPLLNFLRGLLILFLTLFALVSAIGALLGDGRPISAGLAVIYGISAAAIGLAMSRLQARAARQVGSPMLEVDARNWFVDGIISCGAATAFLAAFVLSKTPWSHLTPYVDPLLVVVMVIALIRIPLVTIWENLREVLMVAPAPDVQEDIRRRTEAAVADLDARSVHTRMWKVGRVFYVMIHVVLPEAFPCRNVGEIDGLRRRILGKLDGVGKGITIDVIVTADAAYASGVETRPQPAGEPT